MIVYCNNVINRRQVFEDLLVWVQSKLQIMEKIRQIITRRVKHVSGCYFYLSF